MSEKHINFPKLYVITPTLNSERTLAFCLSSLKSQDYPGRLEIIIVDGGSQDSTIKIAKKYKVKIVPNKLKTGEAGKAVGASYSKGEILGFIDSDNILPNKSSLRKMVRPFLDDPKIIATEPLYFTYRKNDHWLTRYFALLGMGDPLNIFIGNYDRYSFISNKWTGLNIHFEEKDGYLTLYLKDKIPTIGANGFFIRKTILKKYPRRDYLFDIDVVKFLSEVEEVRIAKVKEGIIHLFSGNISTFIRKQRRRIRDFIYYHQEGIRAKERDKLMILWGILKFVLATITFLPLVAQMFSGYMRKKDHAWFFHPLACWLTLFAYSLESIRSIFVREQFDRRGWGQ